MEFLQNKKRQFIHRNLVTFGKNGYCRDFSEGKRYVQFRINIENNTISKMKIK
jgi:hypothetical protein